LGTLGLWVLELFAKYAMDGQTDGRTKATLIASFPTTAGGITTQTRFVTYPSKPQRNAVATIAAYVQVEDND